MEAISIDAGLAVLLVRATARVSAVILAANLLAARRRLDLGGPAAFAPLTLRRAKQSALRTSHAPAAVRGLDVATFGAFIASHTVHFICVGLLTIATAGANIDARGGYTGVIVLGILFYVACVAVMRVKLRPSLEWTTSRQRGTELWLLIAIWLAFFQAYATRPLQSSLFAVLAVVLLYSIARFTMAALRSKDSASPVRIA